jgi:hypothetical protein
VFNDNARPHTGTHTAEILPQLNFEVLNNSSYSLDLASMTIAYLVHPEALPEATISQVTKNETVGAYAWLVIKDGGYVEKRCHCRH